MAYVLILYNTNHNERVNVQRKQNQLKQIRTINNEPEQCRANSRDTTKVSRFHCYACDLFIQLSWSTITLVFYSLSRRTSYFKISWSLEATRFEFRHPLSRKKMARHLGSSTVQMHVKLQGDKIIISNLAASRPKELTITHLHIKHCVVSCIITSWHENASLAIVILWGESIGNQGFSS